VKADGTESVLYNFSGCTGASEATGQLIVDPTGNLYGTALLGGAYCDDGVIFKLTP
jgi:uncharacterized repeat protein (TIGR03803 family)